MKLDAVIKFLIPKFSIQKRVVIPIILIFGLAVSYVWEQVTYSQLAMEVDKLRHQKDRLFQLNQYLKAEIDNKTRFEIIEKQAKTQLGMHFSPDSPIILVVPDKDTMETIKQTVKSYWRTIWALLHHER